MSTADRAILLEIFRHHLWANQTLLEICAAQPDEVLDAAGEAATWTSDWREQTYTSRKLVALLQAINHGTEHREQIEHALSVAGLEPPEIYGWAYSFTAGLIRPAEATSEG